MATIFSAPFIPATNWIAPETPQHMMSFGLTVRPESPIWQRASVHPASTSARVLTNFPSSSSASS